MLSYLKCLAPHVSLPALLVRGFLILALGAPVFLVGVAPAQAAAPSEAAYTAPAAPLPAAADPLRALIFKLGGDIVALLLFIAGVLLVISVVKGGVEAQLNTIFGSPMGLSKAYMNIITAVILGVLTLLSPILVTTIFNALGDSASSASITVPNPSVTIQ